MPYFSYRQTRFKIFISLLPEYRVKFLRFLKLLFGFFLLFSITATIFGALDNEEGFTFSKIVDFFIAGNAMLVDFLPFSESANDGDAALASAARWIGFIYTCLFSGIAVAIFTEQVNVISFARFAVIDLKDNCFRIRVWIKQPERFYLHDATMEFSIYEAKEQNKGELRSEFLYKCLLPKDNKSTPIEKFSALRGVWAFDISLDDKSAYYPNNTLRHVFNQLPSLSDVRIAVRLSGTLTNGRYVYREHRYNFKTILKGYDFVSIRWDEVKGVEKVPIERQEFHLWNLYHEHFDFLIRQETLSNNEFSVFNNKPEDVFLLEETECARAKQYIQSRLYLAGKAVTGWFKKIDLPSFVKRIVWVLPQSLKSKKAIGKNSKSFYEEMLCYREMVSALFSKDSSIYVDSVVEVAPGKYKMMIFVKAPSKVVPLRILLLDEVVFGTIYLKVEVINSQTRECCVCRRSLTDKTIPILVQSIFIKLFENNSLFKKVVIRNNRDKRIVEAVFAATPVQFWNGKSSKVFVRDTCMPAFLASELFECDCIRFIIERLS